VKPNAGSVVLGYALLHPTYYSLPDLTNRVWPT
jgi:hypothetical protein